MGKSEPGGSDAHPARTAAARMTSGKREAILQPVDESQEAKPVIQIVPAFAGNAMLDCPWLDDAFVCAIIISVSLEVIGSPAHRGPGNRPVVAPDSPLFRRTYAGVRRSA